MMNRRPVQPSRPGGMRSLPDAADPHREIVSRRLPQRRGGGHLVAGPNVLDLSVGAAEPDGGDAASVGVADRLAELVGLGGHFRRDAAGTERPSDRVGLSPGLLVVHGDQYGRGHAAAGYETALGEQRY